MSYIDIYSKNMLDVVSLGWSINNFNMELGDYIKVEIYNSNGEMVRVGNYQSEGISINGFAIL